MDLLLAPFKVLRGDVASVFIPTISIIVLLAYIVVAGGGVQSSSDLLNKMDSYLGGRLYPSAADLTSYNDLSANIQLPLIRLGGIAETMSVYELIGGTTNNQTLNLTAKTTNATGGALLARGASGFFLAFLVLFLGFLCYAMVCQVVHFLRGDAPSLFGLKGINGPTIVLSLFGAFLNLL